MTDRLDLDWVVQATGGRLERYRQVEITGFSIDSRTLRPGELFIALRGERTDGHLFLNEAFQGGASGALVSRDIGPAEGPHNIIRVEDTKAALQRLAQAWRDQFNIPIIGITGSSGKTTTKELLFAMLTKGVRAYRSPGNYNTEIGLPLAILGMPTASEVGVFELGLQRPGEIGRLAGLLKPTIGVITDVGDAHRGFFRDRGELVENKWQLIARLPQEGLAVLNYDSPHLRGRTEQLNHVISFGIEGQADYRVARFDDTRLEGLRFTILGPDGLWEAQTGLLGRFNLYNILASTAVARHLGIGPEGISEALREFRPIPHRMELKRSKLGLIIDDSYNANPSSIRAALTALASLRTPRRKILVFGEMLELGDFAVQAHREAAEVIDELGLDLVFTLGELAGETGRALQERGWGERVLLAGSMKEIEGALLSRLTDDQNLILIKGSRAMELDQLVGSLP